MPNIQNTYIVSCYSYKIVIHFELNLPILTLEHLNLVQLWGVCVCVCVCVREREREKENTIGFIASVLSFRLLSDFPLASSSSHSMNLNYSHCEIPFIPIAYRVIACQYSFFVIYF